MKRICLIVDHPLRDLEGLVLLAAELVDDRMEVFLVPMYQRHEVFLLQPDLVIVNYVRFANAGFVEACHRAGMLVAVLDTEGGVQQDMQAFAGRVARHLGKVALYCAWGREQRDALERNAHGQRIRVVATGAPRYDFAVPPLIDAVRESPSQYDGIVLVDTNFPIINPKFQSTRSELHDLVHGIGYDEGYIREFMKQSRVAQSEIVKAVRVLAMRFPLVAFVVRPHPFEDARTYANLLGNIPNIHVIQEGTVLEWIRRACVVIHHSCSTAIETFLMGKEPVALRWIEAPLLEQPLAIAVSLPVHSLEGLITLVGNAAAGTPLPVPSLVLSSRRRISEEYFCGNDGRAAARVAGEVDALLTDQDPKRPRASGRLSLLRVQPGLRAKASLALAMTLGTSGYAALRRALRRGTASAAKTFGVADITEIVGRLALVRPASAEVNVAAVTVAQLRVHAPGRVDSVRLWREPAQTRQLTGTRASSSARLTDAFLKGPG